MLFRSPGAYTIPSPGEEYAVSDELTSDSLAYKWFTYNDHEVLVLIAYSLPESEAEPGEREAAAVGDAAGWYSESGESRVLELRDGGVLIRVVFYNAERDDVFDYAGRLLSENSE